MNATSFEPRNPWPQQPTWAVGLLAALLIIYYPSALLAGELENVAQILLLLWALAILCVPRWRDGGVDKNTRWLCIAFSLVFIISCASWLVNGMGYEGWKLVFRYFRFVLFIPLFFLMRRYATPQLFWFATGTGAILCGLWAIIEDMGVVEGFLKEESWDDRVSGNVNPIQFGDLILAMVVITAMAIGRIRSRPLLWNTLAATACVLGLYACLASGTRGAWIALPILLLLFAWNVWRSHNQRGRMAIIGALAILVSISIVEWSTVSKGIDQAVEEIQDYQSGVVNASVGGRLESWRAAWILFQEAPVLGHGPMGFETGAPGLHEQGLIHEYGAMHHPHNEYLRQLVAHGLMGLGALLILFLAPLWVALRHMNSHDRLRRGLGLSAALLIVAFMHFALTESIFKLTSFIGFYVVTLAAIMGMLLRPSAKTARSEAS